MSAVVNGKTSKRKVSEPSTNWKRLRSMTDAEIHSGVVEDPDIQPTDKAFWRKAELIMPRSNKTVTMRLDADLLDWFRSNRGYQTRINAILRAYMDAQLRHR
jgi:uncharacterized protein (DUF4415 family)